MQPQSRPAPWNKGKLIGHKEGRGLMRSGPDLSSHTTLRFYVLGDFGTGDRFQAKVAEALAFMARREPPTLSSALVIAST